MSRGVSKSILAGGASILIASSQVHAGAMPIAPSSIVNAEPMIVQVVERHVVNRNVHVNRNVNVNRNAHINRNVNVNRNVHVNRGVYRGANVYYHGGRWVRPGSYWWPVGGAIAAGAAIGFVSAATAASWAGQAPGPNYCWYYTDPSQRQGFWDVCQ